MSGTEDEAVASEGWQQPCRVSQLHRKGVEVKKWYAPCSLEVERHCLLYGLLTHMNHIK